MTATFLLAINLDDAADLMGMAEQIQEELNEEGYDVTSVKPWDRAAVVAPAFLPPMSTPPDFLEPAGEDGFCSAGDGDEVIKGLS